MLKIILVGASGAMGRTLSELALEKEGIEIVAGLAEKEDTTGSYPVYTDFGDIKEEADVLVDFSNRALLDPIIDFAKKKAMPVVFATTGYTDEDLLKIKNLGEDVALIQEGNYSLGINTMIAIAKELSKALADFDIEIVEGHHKYKKDNPSGTATMLFDSVNEGRNGRLKKKMRDFSHDDRRDKDDVGISSVRGGTIVGVHKLIFAGLDEELEITHRAGSKKIFAVGALKAASFLKGKDAGVYDFKEVLRLD